MEERGIGLFAVALAIVSVGMMIGVPCLSSAAYGSDAPGISFRAATSSIVLGKTLVIAMDINIETMDPSKTASMYGPPSMVLETLITRDKTGAYQPGLADSWGWNLTDPGHPIFEIHLKSGVVFQDGTPFNAQAVKDDIMWYKQSDPSGLYGWVSYEFAAINTSDGLSEWGDMDNGVWVKDDHNLVFNCTYYDAALIFNLSHLYGSMMSPTAAFGSGETLEQAHENYGTPLHPAVGTGPYMISEWVPGDHVTLARFTDYNWGFGWYTNNGPANIDRIVYRVILDDATRYAAFESGDVDVLMKVPPSKLMSYSSDPSLSLITGPGQGVYYIEFNCQKAPWTNVDLRKAIGFTINRSEIVNMVWHGYAEPGVNYVSPINPEGALIPSQYNFSYNLTRAGGLFAAAGWWDRDSDGWLENASGSELTMPLATTNKEQDVLMSELIQQQLNAAGVHVTLTYYEQPSLLTLAVEGQLNTMLFWYGWPRAEVLDWKFGSWAAGGGSNTAQYIDPVFDEYVMNWTYAPSAAAYSENATRAHERLLTMAPWAPVIFWHQIVVVHDWVTGWYVNPVGEEQVFDAVDVDVDHPPISSLVVTPNPVTSGTSVVLDGSGSADDIGVVNWTWTLTDDGTPVVLWDEIASFTPTMGPQTISIDLTVRDVSGWTNTSSVTLVVSAAIPEFSMVWTIAGCAVVMAVIIGARGRKA